MIRFPYKISVSICPLRHRNYQKGSILASYSRDKGFEFRLTDSLSWCVLSTCMRLLHIWPQPFHLLRPCQVIIHGTVLLLDAIEL